MPLKEGKGSLKEENISRSGVVNVREMWFNLIYTRVLLFLITVITDVCCYYMITQFSLVFAPAPALDEFDFFELLIF